MTGPGIVEVVARIEQLRTFFDAEQVAVTFHTSLGPTVLIVGRGGQRAIEAAGELVTFDVEQ